MSNLSVEEYSRVLNDFKRKHKWLIWATSWMKITNQIRIVKLLSGAKWPIVHDAFYNRGIYKQRYEVMGN